MFGAYTHCKWPEHTNGDVVSDPSGQSFLFSLVNATGKAVRFSLRRRNGAIGLVSVGVCFGYNGPNFVLNIKCSAFDGDRENHVHALDERSTYQPDDGDMNRDADFFAGSEYFAAADIEVYEL